MLRSSQVGEHIGNMGHMGAVQTQIRGLEERGQAQSFLASLRGGATGGRLRAASPCALLLPLRNIESATSPRLAVCKDASAGWLAARRIFCTSEDCVMALLRWLSELQVSDDSELLKLCRTSA